MAINENNKNEAYIFLRELEECLMKSLPHYKTILPEIHRICKQAKLNDHEKHLRLPHDVFIYHYVFPLLKELMRKAGMDAIKTRESLLSEAYRNMPEMISGSPVRELRHPFNKKLEKKPSDIIKQWRSQTKDPILNQICPDFTTRNPFPYKIIFEGKYFSDGSVAEASSELAAALYETFFYRSLPFCPRTETHAEWDYDYSCLLALDASEEGNLRRVWETLHINVKNSFWNSANIYVMILRPAGK